MTPIEQNIFFELLRAAIWQRDVDIRIFDAAFSWGNICRALESHALLALAADAIMKVNDYLPAEKQLNPMQQMAIMQHSATVAQTHYELNNAIIKTFSVLQQAGCHPLLLKGQGLATLYPLSNTRSCGDIDIYVGLSEYDKVCRAIRQMINNPAAEAQAEEEAHHYEIHDGNIIYEIHRYPSVAGNQRYQDRYYALSSLYLAPGTYDSMTIGSTPIQVPTLQYNVLYVFNHLCQHIWEGGVGIKQLIDWMLLLNHALKNTDFSLERLKIDLKQIGLYRAWQILGGVLVNQLGMPQSAFPFWDDRLSNKSQGYYLDELVGGATFATKTKFEKDYKSQTGLNRKIEALKYYYSLCRPVSIISPLFAAQRFLFFLKHAANPK